jgi:hypothetical protein
MVLHFRLTRWDRWCLGWQTTNPQIRWPSMDFGIRLVCVLIARDRVHTGLSGALQPQ